MGSLEASSPGGSRCGPGRTYLRDSPPGPSRLREARLHEREGRPARAGLAGASSILPESLLRGILLDEFLGLVAQILELLAGLVLEFHGLVLDVLELRTGLVLDVLELVAGPVDGLADR